MNILEIHQKHKKEVETALQELYEGYINAGIGTRGEYKNNIKELEKQLVEVNEKIGAEVKQSERNMIPETPDVKIIKLFLASSSELKNEREQFEIFINRENNNLIQQKQFIRL